MNFASSNKDVQEYVSKYYKEDLSTIILKGSPFPGVTPQELAIQLKGKRIAEKKFPSFFKLSGILYPKTINLEQASSEVTAVYKSGLVSGRGLADLTGGFGIDSYFFSKNMEQVYHCEFDRELSEIARHNFKILQADNITSIPGDGIEFIRSRPVEFDWIYIDPSRRTSTGGRVFRLEECTPDIPKHLHDLWSRSDQIMIKTSPLLDLEAAINELQHVKEIHIIALGNDVKELIWILKRGFIGDPLIKTVNFETRSVQEYQGNSETGGEIRYGIPKRYIYEPNAAIMKSGLFNNIALDFKLEKLHRNTHLYTSDNLIDFPGRRFRLLKTLPYKKKMLLDLLPERKANITTRNFPDSVASIRKSTGIKEGGRNYLLFTTTRDGTRRVLYCTKC